MKSLQQVANYRIFSKFIHPLCFVDECPAVSLISFNQSTLEVHKRQLETLISRDKHHPSVIFWSVANEAESQKPEAEEYFRQVTELARSLDHTRPITAAINKPFDGCYLSQFLDVIMLNRYIAWYSSSGSFELIKQQLLHEFELFHSKYRKPMMISEYGADTVSGLHQAPSRPFSEDYQVDYIRAHFEAFDELYKRKYFFGEVSFTRVIRVNSICSEKPFHVCSITKCH